ncbi:unnamed protein product, partial [Prorocentrum cordatum]
VAVPIALLLFIVARPMLDPVELLEDIALDCVALRNACARLLVLDPVVLRRDAVLDCAALLGVAALDSVALDPAALLDVAVLDSVGPVALLNAAALDPVALPSVDALAPDAMLKKELLVALPVSLAKPPALDPGATINVAVLDSVALGPVAPLIFAVLDSVALGPVALLNVAALDFAPPPCAGALAPASRRSAPPSRPPPRCSTKSRWALLRRFNVAAPDSVAPLSAEAPVQDAMLIDAALAALLDALVDAAQLAPNPVALLDAAVLDAVALLKDAALDSVAVGPVAPFRAQTCCSRNAVLAALLELTENAKLPALGRAAPLNAAALDSVEPDQVALLSVAALDSVAPVNVEAPATEALLKDEALVALLASLPTRGCRRWIPPRCSTSRPDPVALLGIAALDSVAPDP